MLMTAICNTKSLRQVTDLLLVVTGRMMCSKGCKDISDGMHSLVQESRAKGAIRLPSPDYPPGFAVTFTAGLDTNDHSQTDTVLPAAENLLPSFAHDYQELASFGTVPLVKSFICRTHPLWYYNQTYTAVLFSGVPSDGFVNLKVWPQTTPACRILCRVWQLHLKTCLMLIACSLGIVVWF